MGLLQYYCKKKRRVHLIAICISGACINVQRDVGNLSELYWLNQNCHCSLNLKYKLNFRLKLMAALARHLNFLVPSQVRALLVVEQQLLLEQAPTISNAPHLTICKCYNYELLHHLMATPTISTTSQWLVSPYRAM